MCGWLFPKKFPAMILWPIVQIVSRSTFFKFLSFLRVLSLDKISWIHFYHNLPFELLVQATSNSCNIDIRSLGITAAVIFSCPRLLFTVFIRWAWNKFHTNFKCLCNKWISPKRIDCLESLFYFQQFYLGYRVI